MSEPITHPEEAITVAIETALHERGWLDSGDAQDAAPEIANALADLLAARDRRVRAVLDEYFDFDVDPWDDHDAACPAPEDVWRLHRDLKAALEAER